MAEYHDYETILDIIEAAIGRARQTSKPAEATADDNYIAWVILQELRRAGWTISPAQRL